MIQAVFDITTGSCQFRVARRVQSDDVEHLVDITDIYDVPDNVKILTSLSQFKSTRNLGKIKIKVFSDNQSQCRN